MKGRYFKGDPPKPQGTCARTVRHLGYSLPLLRTVQLLKQRVLKAKAHAVIISMPCVTTMSEESNTNCSISGIFDGRLARGLRLQQAPSDSGLNDPYKRLGSKYFLGLQILWSMAWILRLIWSQRLRSDGRRSPEKGKQRTCARLVPDVAERHRSPQYPQGTLER